MLCITNNAINALFTAYLQEYGQYIVLTKRKADEISQGTGTNEAGLDETTENNNVNQDTESNQENEPSNEEPNNEEEPNNKENNRNEETNKNSDDYDENYYYPDGNSKEALEDEVEELVDKLEIIERLFKNDTPNRYDNIEPVKKEDYADLKDIMHELSSFFDKDSGNKNTTEALEEVKGYLTEELKAKINDLEEVKNTMPDEASKLGDTGTVKSINEMKSEVTREINPRTETEWGPRFKEEIAGETKNTEMSKWAEMWENSWLKNNSGYNWGIKADKSGATSKTAKEALENKDFIPKDPMFKDPLYKEPIYKEPQDPTKRDTTRGGPTGESSATGSGNPVSQSSTGESSASESGSGDYRNEDSINENESVYSSSETSNTDSANDESDGKETELDIKGKGKQVERDNYDRTVEPEARENTPESDDLDYESEDITGEIFNLDPNDHILVYLPDTEWIHIIWDRPEQILEQEIWDYPFDDTTPNFLCEYANYYFNDIVFKAWGELTQYALELLKFLH